MKSRNLSLLFILSMLLFSASIAQATDYKTKLTLTIASSGPVYDEVYTLTVPGETAIKKSGWNSLGNITATYSGNKDGFDTSKKLVVTATTSNDFKLKASGVTDTVAYYVATASDDTGPTTTFEFTAAQINAKGSGNAFVGTSKPIGVNVEDYSKKAAGNYADEITYKATVVDDVPAGKTVDLSTLSRDYEAQNGDILTGTLNGSTQPYKITIADGASITLKDATINGVHDSSYAWAGITSTGNATITLEGTNTVKGFSANYPGIFAADGYTLTIKGTGSLDAIGGRNNYDQGWGAGIGGRMGQPCGNIAIEGGTITATGGMSAAGIGGAAGGTCGSITIASTVTKVTATKGDDTAPNSIGAGAYNGTCGTVTIGGTVGAISTSPYTYQPVN